MTYSQSSGTYGATPQIMTPEAASLGKFGSYPMSYHTGAINVNIPLYSLAENSFSLNIGLQYDQSGFIPNKESGTVGLNWSLMAGGIITRTVNGSPDDRNQPAFPSLLNGHVGYIYGMLNANLGTYSKSYIQNLDFLNISSQGVPSSDIPYEYYPDIFSFNFDGHQGRFILGNDGEVKVISDKNYKIDLTDFSGQDDLCLCENSEITIITDNGDAYTFGGDINTLDITYPYNPPTAPENSPTDRGIDCSKGVINAWHIKKVKLVNGREIIFNYEAQSRDVFLFADDIHGINSNVDYAYEKIYFSDRFTKYFDNGPQTSNTTGTNSRSLVKTCYLNSIVSTNGKIEFFYSVKPYPFYGTDHVVKNPNQPKQLDKIKITNTSESFSKEIFCTYEYWGTAGAGFRQFLTKIEFKDNLSATINAYNLSYYKTNVLPDPLTRGIDIWGYYNGKNSNASLIPTVSSGSPDYNLDLTNRAVDPTFCDVGMLLKVEFPTGGWSEFLYEGHDYSKVLRRKVQTSIEPVWENEEGDVGGARIKEVKHSTGESQKFFYKKNYDPIETEQASSGILVDHNIFYLQLDYYYNSTWSNVQNVIVSDNNIGVGSSYGESPIAYSEITEVNSPGYTKYFYSTHETNPDVYSLGANSYQFSPDPDNSLNNFRLQLQRLMKYSSCEIERGKLLKIQVFNDNSQPVKEIINEYNNDVARYNESVIGFNAPSPFTDIGYAVYHANAFYCFQNNITKQTINETRGDGNVVTTVEDYNYISNSNPLLRKKTYKNSIGQTLSDEYKYPLDNQSPSPNVYNYMVDRHMVNLVIEETKTNVTLSNKELLKVKTNFKIWTDNNLINPATIEKSLSGATPELETEINNYDGQGNILQLTGRDGIITSFEWQYQNTYPVVEIKNAKNSLPVFDDQPFNTSLALATGQNEATAILTTYTGDITLNLDANPGKTYSLEYSLVGPVVRSGTLCASSSSTPCHVNHSSSLTFNNMPAGTYTLYLYYYGSDPDVFRRVSYTYPRRQIATPAYKEFYYQGFEESDGDSSDGDSKAGRKSKTNGYAKSIANLTDGEYVLSYWKKNVDNSWALQKSIITVTGGSHSFNLSGQIDEIRLHPKKAKMNTYTYEPMIGVTSKCDINNRFTFYEYDSFGRLKTIRDQDGKVVKTFDYQYQVNNNQ